MMQAEAAQKAQFADNIVKKQDESEIDNSMQDA